MVGGVGGRFVVVVVMGGGGGGDADGVVIVRALPPAWAGWQDPTPFLYNTTCYTMAGLMVVAAASHAMVRKLTPEQVEKYGGEPPPK